MRSLIALILAGMAGVLAGCVYAGFYETDGRTVTSPWSDSTPPHKIYFPYVLKYPDETDDFFPPSNDPPVSDLNLAAIDCEPRDGSLLINAHVLNNGSDVVPSKPLLTGFLGAFRVVAAVTTATGEREELEAVQRLPLNVPDATDLRLGPTRVRADQVVAIDVVVDPDRVVPDPLRENNSLSWRGTMQAANPQCVVVR